jgi:hypothetical protein
MRVSLEDTFDYVKQVFVAAMMSRLVTN